MSGQQQLLLLEKKINLEIKKEIHFPHSLGFYIQHLLIIQDLKLNSGEYKLMGLAPYGNPKFKDKILII